MIRDALTALAAAFYKQDMPNVIPYGEGTEANGGCDECWSIPSRHCCKWDEPKMTWTAVIEVSAEPANEEERRFCMDLVDKAGDKLMAALVKSGVADPCVSGVLNKGGEP